jgi:hypothetical protein
MASSGSAEEEARGFKGWYFRGYLPHFDAPGRQQFITYHLADSLPSELHHEWEEAMRLEDDREKFRRMEVMLDRWIGDWARVPCASRGSLRWSKTTYGSTTAGLIDCSHGKSCATIYISFRRCRGRLAQS